MERFEVPAKSEVVLGYTMGEESEVVECEPDEDYKGGRIVLSGPGDCVDRLIYSWSQFFDKVDVKILKYSEKYLPWKEIFQVKRSYYRRMGSTMSFKKIEVILRYDKGLGCVPNGMNIEGIVPLNNYNVRINRPKDMDIVVKK